MPEIASAAAVANTFLNLQEHETTSVPRIDPMKLQKLLFYAQAWRLALKGEPLFVEEVYAWPWGPVVPNIYGMFKDFGRHPIVGRRATELVKVGAGPLSFQVREPYLEGEAADFARSVWESHKGLSGVQLSNATHAAGEPWTIVKDRYGTLDSKPLIPNDLIKEVFRNKLPAQ